MDNSALIIVKQRIVALLEGIQITGPTALFKDVFMDGEAIDETEMAAISELPVRNIAAIHWGPETVSETTVRTMKTMPFSIEVKFILPIDEDGTPNMTSEEVGAYILGELQKALLSATNRRLPGSSPSAAAIDMRYAGGGSEVIPMSDESPCMEFGIATDWEVDYRNKTDDPTTVM